MSGMSEDEIVRLTTMDPWFIRQLGDLYQTECWLQSLSSMDDLSVEDWTQVKRRGYSDVQISRAFPGTTEADVRQKRKSLGVVAAMKRVDTCAAEFESDTPYMYSSLRWQLRSETNECTQNFDSWWRTKPNWSKVLNLTIAVATPPSHSLMLATKPSC